MLRLAYQRGTVRGLRMQVFAEAEYTGKNAGKKSVLGGVVMRGGACVSWFSWTQPCVTRLTTGAEYLAVVDVLKDMSVLRQIWRF